MSIRVSPSPSEPEQYNSDEDEMVITIKSKLDRLSIAISNVSVGSSVPLRVGLLSKII